MRISNQPNNLAALKAIDVNFYNFTRTGVNRYGCVKGWFLPEELEPAFLAAREKILHDQAVERQNKPVRWEDTLDDLKWELATEAEDSGLVEGEDFLITWDGRFILLGED
jgi:hypothetical protein